MAYFIAILRMGFLTLRGRDDDEVEELALTQIKLFKLTEQDGAIKPDLFDNQAKHLDRGYALEGDGEEFFFCFFYN
jgi:hypothetical protein